MFVKINLTHVTPAVNTGQLSRLLRFLVGPQFKYRYTDRLLGLIVFCVFSVLASIWRNNTLNWVTTASLHILLQFIAQKITPPFDAVFF
jgi:hypothetical protein